MPWLIIRNTKQRNQCRIFFIMANISTRPIAFLLRSHVLPVSFLFSLFFSFFFLFARPHMSRVIRSTNIFYIESPIPQWPSICQLQTIVEPADLSGDIVSPETCCHRLMLSLGVTDIPTMWDELRQTLAIPVLESEQTHKHKKLTRVDGIVLLILCWKKVASVKD